MKDPVVQEIRKIREEIVRECREKNISIMDHLKEVQAKHKGQVVEKPFSPRRKKTSA